MIQVLIITAVLLALAFLGLGISVLFKKGGKFPEHRVGHNKEMRKRKVDCIKTQDKIEQKAAFQQIRVKRLHQESVLTNRSNLKNLKNLSLINSEE